MIATSTNPQTKDPLSGSSRAFAFEISRRVSRTGVDPAAVAVRRVVVYAAGEEAARAGAGVGRDEVGRLVICRPWEALTGSRRPAREELADFYETIGNALATGAGMAQSLNMAARVAQSPVMRGVIGSLQVRVLHGEPLHVAMRAFPRVFVPMHLALVEAAAATGLDKAGGLFVTLAVRLNKEGKIARKFVSALAYPVSLLLLTAVGAVVLEIWALPPMVELFQTLGGRLPPITQAFYRIAQLIHENGLWLAPVLGASVAVGAVALPRLRRTDVVQRMAVRAWLVGPIVQWMALVRALSTFILLKQSGAKVRDQFAMAGAAAGNSVVRGFFEACYHRIAFGESVEEAFTAERHRLRDDGVRIAGKMEVGMAGADLPSLINRIVSELDEKADARLNLLPNALRWPLLVVCCTIIGAVALAIVLPYPSLIADVAQNQAAAAAGK